MDVRIDKTKLKSSHETPFLVVDAIMMVLILTNLSWLLFDTLFTSELVRQGLFKILPNFTEYYATQVHPNFILYDLVFVSIFITELLIRWMIAIKRHTYHRWWFFPFIHWYDVLGCIPVGSFRWLRLLRVISIVYRLERANIIDISSTPPVRFVIKYANVLMEEVSKRVVVNVLDSLQDEIKEGTPVVNNIIDQVITPRLPELTEWARSRVIELSNSDIEEKKLELQRYIDNMVEQTFAQNTGVHALEKIPRIGKPIAEIVEQGVSQLIYDLADHIAADVARADTEQLIEALTEAVSHKMTNMPDKARVAGREMAIEALEVIKDEAKVQKWKLAEKDANSVPLTGLPI